MNTRNKMSFVSLTQVEAMQTIVKAAMHAGQTRARIQTLHFGHHFTYSRNHPVETQCSGATFAVHDTWTLTESKTTRVALSVMSLELLEWVRSQGMLPLLATLALDATGERPADFLHVMAVFVPITVDAERYTQPDALVAWNTTYMLKCLDETRIRYWATRCHNALCMGQTHVAICTLYWKADFGPTGSIVINTPRHYITMQLLVISEMWFLDARLAVLANWVSNIGYTWTLCAPAAECPPWAYFVVLLDPLPEYHALK